MSYLTDQSTWIRDETSSVSKLLFLLISYSHNFPSHPLQVKVKQLLKWGFECQRLILCSSTAQEAIYMTARFAKNCSNSAADWPLVQ